MNIVISGVCGFIGSNLAKRLIAENHTVIGLDNMLTGSERNIESLMTNPNFVFVKHDVIKPIDLDDDIDWIIHLASPASPPKYLTYPIETLRTNSEGTRNLLELALKKNARFLYSSTSEVYGNPQVHPQSEDYWGNVNPIGPRSVYDEAKRYGEALVMAYNRKFNLSTRIVRIFNTYGPGMDPDDGRVISNFVVQALKGEPITVYGNGMQTRSFQYIDDLIEGILKVMEVEFYEPINLGNPEEYTVLELANKVLQLTKSKSTIIFKPLPENDPERRKPNIDRAKKILGWEPRVDLEEGLKRTINYFKELLNR
ncbi:NAD-dependent epimerase/dehydratase [Caldicellulosiruptor acetigenus I77R1B]|jgi:nucleoside-diphosphate-sugar epimerase|uniref:NAD-dependent epimerase/dehydratase n=1 Tax=Caldicellulosiruptor acetigenus (strain ATCC 700853 / DSM 12137 / I77R1B) TaxID=632335 RepID=E4S7Y0_CALA7|nr:UDP-glucuronic acid decarboxylase family protein [Caldicellulosiruptor acetigenus]ADQ41880.1 NAD-dependent epimerase/dehydratase [Caldicellulosiruptor acetigenus I77R1B]